MLKLRPLNVLLCSLTIAFCVSLSFADEQSEGITLQYQKALEMDPDDMDVRYLLGVSLLREKSYKEALFHLLKVFPSRSSQAEMNYNIGLAYAGAGDLRKAFEHYKKVDEINSVDARSKFRLDIVFYNLGIAFQREGNMDEALKAYQEAIEIYPDQSNAYCQKGEVLYQKKDYVRALESLNICMERLPQRKETKRYICAIYENRGIELLNLKDYVSARTELEKAQALDPENETAYYNMGYLEYLEGNYRKALSFLDKIKGTKREDMKKAIASMFQNIGGAMQESEEWDGAITAFSGAVALNAENPDLRFYLGYSQMKVKDFDSAISSFKETLKLDPKHQRAAVNLAMASEIALKSHLEAGADLMKKNSFYEAMKEFDLALLADPNNQKGIEGRSEAEKEIEKFKREALEKKEREITARLLEGERYLTEGRYLEARKSFEGIVASEPGNAKAHEGLKKSAAMLTEAVDKYMVRAEKAFSEKRFYNASLDYKTASELDPDNREAYIRLEESRTRLMEQVSPIMNEAGKLEDAKNFPEALMAYDKILDLQPDHKDALASKTRISAMLDKEFNEALSKGREQAKAGELMKAAEYLGRALELKPDSQIALDEFKSVSGKLKGITDIRLADAASALKAGRYADAVTNYKAVLLIDRENKEAAEGLKNASKLRDEVMAKKLSTGLRALKDGNYSQAISAAGEMLQVDPGNKEAQSLQKEAKAKIDELISPWLKAGMDAYKKGDLDGAIVSFKKVLNVDSGNREAREYMGKMDIQKAKVSVDKDIDKNYLKGIELYTSGKYRDAIESWKKVLELDPKHEKALLNIEKAKRKMEGVMETK